MATEDSSPQDEFIPIPCPFCGADGGQIGQASGNYVCLICSVCKAGGPPVPDKDKPYKVQCDLAIQFWNQRVPIKTK